MPEDFGVREVYAVVKEFGDIAEVVISPRRDKREKMYGFARFHNIKDERMISTTLDNIIIESTKSTQTFQDSIWRQRMMQENEGRQVQVQVKGMRNTCRHM